MKNKPCKGDGEHCWDAFKNHAQDKKCCWCGVRHIFQTMQPDGKGGV